jgi:FkbM family methyltransferase
VHAFEPQPGLAAMIRASAARNGFQNVHVHEVALAEADGEGELVVEYGNAGTATLVPLAEQNGAHRRLRVRCVAAQHYLAEHCGGPTRLAKLDVEGFELPILRAADRYFRDNPPDVVVFESNAGRGDAADPVTAHLETLGYTAYVLPRVMLRPRLCAVTRACCVKSHDRVAIHPRAEDYADLLRALRAD